MLRRSITSQLEQCHCFLLEQRVLDFATALGHGCALLPFFERRRGTWSTLAARVMAVGRVDQDESNAMSESPSAPDARELSDHVWAIFTMKRLQR